MPLAPTPVGDDEMLDHLVYAVPDLDAAIDDLAERLGVRPAHGGSHPGRGTRNALLALGDDRYLEVIGPDPEQPPPDRRAFGIDDLKEPRLVTWVARAPDIEARVERAKAAGYETGAVIAASRARPDGAIMHWRMTPPATRGDGLVPFVIDWGDTEHPSRTAPGGVSLLSLRAEHPRPEEIPKILEALELSLNLIEGLTPALIATLETPRGTVELR